MKKLFTIHKFRIILSLILSLVISIVLYKTLKPKQNDIPILPHSLKVELQQNEDYTLQIRNISLADTYPSDYQLGVDTNFYNIYLINGSNVLFKGKINKQNILHIDRRNKDGQREGETKIINTPERTLYLPYYPDAEDLEITDESGSTMVSLNLKSASLKSPGKTQNKCGDGVCADNENLLMCFTDCNY